MTKRSPVSVSLNDLFVRRFGKGLPLNFDLSRTSDVDNPHEHTGLGRKQETRTPFRTLLDNDRKEFIPINSREDVPVIFNL